VRLSKALKKRGWTYVGPTTMYALMQATGMVNDHLKAARRPASKRCATIKRPT
jgi:DNA-3-methyladenine glycosylase I